MKEKGMVVFDTKAIPRTEPFNKLPYMQGRQVRLRALKGKERCIIESGYFPTLRD
jgi:hypothetical protein